MADYNHITLGSMVVGLVSMLSGEYWGVRGGGGGRGFVFWGYCNFLCKVFKLLEGQKSVGLGITSLIFKIFLWGTKPVGHSSCNAKAFVLLYSLVVISFCCHHSLRQFFY